MSDDPITSPHRAVGPSIRPSRVPVLQEACLVVLYGEGIGQRIALRDAALVIGRSADVDMQFEDESVSRRHCTLEPVTDSRSGASRWQLTDHRSTNGTFVNDRPITNPTVLQHGDRVQVGRTIFKFLGSGHIEAAYYEEIHRLVTTDGLTGIANRRAIHDTLAREFGRAHRYGRPLALVILDIDHFKTINDTQGHLAGDAALRQVGQLLRNNLRREDFLGRLGGEEFVVILPELDLEHARLVAEKLRKLTAAHAFDYDGSFMRITLSAGVVGRAAEDRDAEEMLRRADALLYVAKRGGRDRVEG